MVEELLAYWSLEDAEDTLEQLEEALIVCPTQPISSDTFVWSLCPLSRQLFLLAVKYL